MEEGRRKGPFWKLPMSLLYMSGQKWVTCLSYLWRRSWTQLKIRLILQPSSEAKTGNNRKYAKSSNVEKWTFLSYSITQPWKHALLGNLVLWMISTWHFIHHQFTLLSLASHRLLCVASQGSREKRQHPSSPVCPSMSYVCCVSFHS